MNLIIILVIIAVTALLIWIFLTSKDEAVIKEEIEEKTQEKNLRRRAADKEIEEEIPEKRRSTDKPPAGKEEEGDNPFKLPYLTDEIIPANSRFRVYRRTLLNSEVYAGKGLYSTAISLYEGVAARINDSITRNKIEENIRYLKNYSQSREESRYKSERTESVTSGDLKFTVDGNTQRKINIEVINSSTEQTIEKIKEEIKNKLIEDINILKSAADTGKGPDTDLMKNEIMEMRDLLKNLSKEKERMQDNLENLRARGDEERSSRDEISTLRNEIDKLKGLEDLNRKEKDEINRLKEEIGRLNNFRDRSQMEKSEIESLNEEIRRLKKIEEQNYQTKSELEKLNDEINRLKSPGEPGIKELPDLSKIDRELGRINDKISSLGTRDARREDENSIDNLKDHIKTLEDKLNRMTEPPFREAKEQPSIVMDTQPLVDLFNRLYSDRSAMNRASVPQQRPMEEEEEPDEEDIFEKIIKDGMKEKKQKAEEKLEEKTTIQKEKTDEDKNEFDLLSDYVKDKGEGDLSDEEIFEKILKDDKKAGPDEESFEIRGIKDMDKGEYDVFSKDEDLKKRDDENFYKSFLKTTRKLKKELPILKVNFDFTKLPDEFSLSKEKNILEYSFYKYKPMLQKADELIKKRKVREAIDYYRVVMDQNIPVEFKSMIKKNIHDLTEYLEKYLTAD